MENFESWKKFGKITSRVIFRKMPVSRPDRRESAAWFGA